MAFDESKDKELWTGQVNDLLVSVHCYNGGDPRLQIGPRVVAKKDGTGSFRKAGRLTAEELAYVIKEYKGEMGALLTGEPAAKPQRKAKK